MKTRLFVLLLAATTLFLACGPEFDPYSRILDFRILAIRSDLPMVRPGQLATIRPLAFSPTGDPITYKWSWCPLRTTGTNNFECPFTDDELNALIAERFPGDLPPGFAFDFDLGTEAEATFRYPGTSELVLQFCRGIQQASAVAGAVPVNCNRGLDITIRLEATSNGKTIVAGKRINLWTESPQSNINPEVLQIDIRPATGEEAAWLIEQGETWVVDPSLPRPEWWVTLDDSAPIGLWANVSLEVRVLVAPNSVELWQPPAPVGSDQEFLPEERENLVYRWMATGGTFEADQRIYDEELNTLENASVTEFRVQRVRDEDSDYDADGITDDQDACPYVPGEVQKDGVCLLTIFGIARDGRLGIDWVQNTILIRGRRP